MVWLGFMLFARRLKQRPQFLRRFVRGAGKIERLGKISVAIHDIDKGGVVIGIIIRAAAGHFFGIDAIGSGYGLNLGPCAGKAADARIKSGEIVLQHLWRVPFGVDCHKSGGQRCVLRQLGQNLRRIGN